jgi:hypothetical protein
MHSLKDSYCTLRCLSTSTSTLSAASSTPPFAAHFFSLDLGTATDINTSRLHITEHEPSVLSEECTYLPSQLTNGLTRDSNSLKLSLSLSSSYSFAVNEKMIIRLKRETVVFL